MAYEILQTCALVNIGLTRGECASWVQAWGSIAAVVGAVAVAFVVPSRQLKADRLRAITAAKLFAGALSISLQGIRRVISENKYEVAVGLKHHIQTASEMGMAIRLDLVPLDSLSQVMGLRSLAAETLAFLAELESGKQTSERLNMYVGHLSDTADELRSKLMAK